MRPDLSYEDYDINGSLEQRELFGLGLCRAELLEEIVFGDNRNAQLLGFLIFPGGGGDIIVDKV